MKKNPTCPVFSQDVCIFDIVYFFTSIKNDAGAKKMLEINYL